MVIDVAVDGGLVQLAARVGVDARRAGREVAAGESRRRACRWPVALSFARIERVRRVVAEEVVADEIGVARAAIDLAADDRVPAVRGRASNCGIVMPVGSHVPLRSRAVVRSMRAPSYMLQPRFARPSAPAICAAGSRRAPRSVLADVADPHVAGRRDRTTSATGCARRDQDLGLAAAGRERVVGRDAVHLAVRGVIDVDAQDLAEQRLADVRARGRGAIDLLAVVARIAAGAAVAGRRCRGSRRRRTRSCRRCGWSRSPGSTG